jgi:hypothetical protein
MKVISTIIYSCVCLWTIFFLFIGIFIIIDFPNRIDRHKRIIDQQFKPAVEFVKKFRIDSNRLPSHIEYYDWEREYFQEYKNDYKPKGDTHTYRYHDLDFITSDKDYVQNDSSEFKNVDWSKDFAIGRWNGDNEDYYFSWSDMYSYDDNWSQLVTGESTVLFIALFPQLIFWTIVLIKRRRSYRMKYK